MTRVSSLLFRPYKLVASPHLPTLRFKPAHIPSSRFNSGTTVSSERLDRARPFYSTLTGAIVVVIACAMINIGIWKYSSKMEAEIAILRKRNADYDKIKEAMLKAGEDSME